jgi:hypothetical protein
MVEGFYGGGVECGLWTGLLVVMQGGG